MLCIRKQSIKCRFDQFLRIEATDFFLWSAYPTMHFKKFMELVHAAYLSTVKKCLQKDAGMLTYKESLIFKLQPLCTRMNVAFRRLFVPLQTQCLVAMPAHRARYQGFRLDSYCRPVFQCRRFFTLRHSTDS